MSTHNFDECLFVQITTSKHQ